jgi:hypothetical protein
MRTGDCFGEVSERMLADPTMLGQPLIAVHGLPTGKSGAAATVGQYPHAWLEFEVGGQELVFDTVANQLVEKARFYELGQITYTVRYEATRLKYMVKKHGNLGPWDRKIIKRDERIVREHGI